MTREFSLLGPWAYWATLSSQMGARLQGSVRAHLAPLSFPVLLADREVVGSAGLMCSRQGGRAQMRGETSPAWSQRRERRSPGDKQPCPGSHRRSPRCQRASPTRSSTSAGDKWVVMREPVLGSSGRKPRARAVSQLIQVGTLVRWRLQGP